MSVALSKALLRSVLPTSLPPAIPNGYFAKVDPANGNIVSAYKIGGDDPDDHISASQLAVDANGNIFVVGSVAGTIAIGTTTLQFAGIFDGFVAKFNPTGNPVWAKNVGAASWDHVISVAVTSNGDCIVGGYYTDVTNVFGTILTPTGNEDLFISKLSGADGNPMWVKGAGGTDYDRVQDISIDASGNSYVTGYFMRTAVFGTTSLASENNSRDVFVVKVNPNGDFAWAKRQVLVLMIMEAVCS